MIIQPKIRAMIVPGIVFLLVLPVLLKLGIWQLERGEFRQSADAKFAVSGKPVVIDDLDAAAVAAFDIHQDVVVTGRYLADRQVLLDNMTQQGKVGVHVLTPFKPADADWIIMVNRGWLEKHAEDDWPERIAVSGSERTITGKLGKFPQPGLRLQAEAVQISWPMLMQFPEHDDIAAIIGMDVVQPLLFLDASIEGGFVRDWVSPGLRPERHFAYAFQWFALALTWVIIFAYLFYRHWFGHGQGHWRNSDEYVDKQS